MMQIKIVGGQIQNVIKSLSHLLCMKKFQSGILASWLCISYTLHTVQYFGPHQGILLERNTN